MIDGLVRSSHGGFCCGMTHVWNFPSSPGVMHIAKLAMEPGAYATYINANPCHSLILNEGFPAQRAEERLDEILSRIDKSRINGIVEAVLTQHQTPYWQKPLRERGFEIVNENMNSNSCNRLFVFHRNS